MSNRIRERLMDQARDEGIVFTPQGEPLFARDIARWREILAQPLPRTPAEVDEDQAAAEREAAWLAEEERAEARAATEQA